MTLSAIVDNVGRTDLGIIGYPRIIGQGEIIPMRELPQGSPTAQEYADLLLSRERLSISLPERGALASAEIAILGVGSVGGRWAESLARLGAGGVDNRGGFRLVDFDYLSYDNLNRTGGTYWDVLGNRRKVDIVAREIHDVQPYAKIVVHGYPVETEELKQMIESADIVIWGLDHPATAMRIHELGKQYQKLVVSALDLGEWGMLRYWDYRDPETQIFDGLIHPENIHSVIGENIPVTRFLAKGIHDPENSFPLEILLNMIELYEGRMKYFIQTNTAASIISGWGAKMVARVYLRGGKASGIKSQHVIKADYSAYTPALVESIESRRQMLLKDPRVRYMLALDSA